MKIMDQKEFDAQNVFGLGQANTAYAQYFTGDSFLNPLTRPQDGLVSGRRQSAREPRARQGRRHSGQRKTLARRDEGQLVLPHRL
mgnify:CR=1 FL=1